MKRNWLKEQLGDAATDELVDAIMAQHGADVNSAKSSADELREQLEAANAKIAEMAEEANGKLTEAERFQKEIDAANKRAERATRELNEATAAAVFAGSGLTEEDYRPLLASVVTADKAKTVANAKAFADLIAAKVSAAKELTEKQALAGMKGPEPGEAADGVPTTREEFSKLSYQRQYELKRDNPEILTQLS